MPARGAVPTIVQGLRCLTHLRVPKWEVKTAREFLHTGLLQLVAACCSLLQLRALAQVRTVDVILQGLRRIMKDSSSVEMGHEFSFEKSFDPAPATPLDKDIAARLHTSAFLDSCEGTARPHRDSDSEISVGFDSSNDDMAVMVYNDQSDGKCASCAELLERLLR